MPSSPMVRNRVPDRSVIPGHINESRAVDVERLIIDPYVDIFDRRAFAIDAAPTFATAKSAAAARRSAIRQKGIDRHGGEKAQH